MDNSENTYLDKLKLYIGSVDTEISRHMKSIKYLFVITIISLLIIGFYICFFVYQNNILADSIIEKINNYEINSNLYTEEKIKVLGASLHKLSKELIEYQNSNEKNKTEAFLEDMKNELLGLHEYVSKLTKYISENGHVDRECILSLKKSIDRIDFQIGSINTTPFQRISDAQEKAFEIMFNIDDDNLSVSDDLLINDIKKYISSIENLKATPHDLYVFIGFFLLLLGFIFSLYKYHYNQIIKYSYQKDLMMKADIVFDIQNAKLNEVNSDLLNRFFDNIDLSVDNSSDQGVMFSLIKNIFKGISVK